MPENDKRITLGCVFFFLYDYKLSLKSNLNRENLLENLFDDPSENYLYSQRILDTKELCKNY